MGCCVTVPQGRIGVKERWGKFECTLEPGLHGLRPFGDNIAYVVDTRVQELKVRCISKTLDNVFVGIEVCVMYRILKEKVKESVYQLSNPREQIKAYVHDVVRAEVPKKTLDEIFVVKEELSQAIKNQLKATMEKYGFEINATPVTDIDPAHVVKEALNERTRHQRLKEAKEQEAEAAKIVQILEAEANAKRITIRAIAEAEAKHQAGLGLSRQRQAIVDGLAESVRHFRGNIEEVDAKQVMDLILVTQYFDMMQAIGTAQNRGTNTIFVPHNPGTVSDIATQVRQGFMEGEAAVLPHSKQKK